MKKRIHSLVSGIQPDLVKLINERDHKTLAIWAADCAERVLPYFEKEFQNDKRPFAAIEACRKWAGGELKMNDARQAAIAAHAAARSANDLPCACSAARSAGHAAATAHTPKHAVYAAAYAIAAMRKSANAAKDVDEAVNAEMDWQQRHLAKLNNLGKARRVRLANEL